MFIAGNLIRGHIVKAAADFKLSMGPMTFPHHLARIMVLEQIYRVEAIQAGTNITNKRLPFSIF